MELLSLYEPIGVQAVTTMCGIVELSSPINVVGSQIGEIELKLPEHMCSERVVEKDQQGKPPDDLPVCTICQWRRSLIKQTGAEAPPWACDSHHPGILKVLHTLPSRVWVEIIATNRLCSPSAPIARGGCLWVRLPLRCEADVAHADREWYCYDGDWYRYDETVTGFHNTQLET